jgi:2-C-methyl-D-erythritol 2,4-cyclodiphosphate synthase
MELHVGQGYDIHQLAEGRKLILGGVEIQSDLGCVAHSDGDALCHAIADAILGAAALGDIGHHFPDTDESLRGISSQRILAEVAEMARRKLWKIVNVDSTILLQRPKLEQYMPAIQERIAQTLKIPTDSVSVKAKTGEKLGDVGHERAIEVLSIALLSR